MGFGGGSLYDMGIVDWDPCSCIASASKPLVSSLVRRLVQMNRKLNYKFIAGIKNLTKVFSKSRI